MDNNIEKSNCICDLLKKIVEIQKEINYNEEEYCAYYKLENKSICYNTRPIILYCSKGIPFEVQISDESLEKSYIFRVEKIKDCCALLRILRIISDSENDNYSLISTDQFITVNTNCFCAVRCLNDTNINENILISEYELFKDDILIDEDSFPFGTHFFETIDSDNTSENPSYRIEIKLYNLPNSSILKLVGGISVDNPNYIINNYNIINYNGYALLTINFTVQTSLSNTNDISLALIENTEQEGLVSFSIENDIGLIVNFSFLMTVITVYP